MRIVIAGGVFALLAFAATAAELTQDVRAKLDRYIDEKTRQVCINQQKAGSPVKADECFATMKPLIKRDLEEAFQTFQQWQIDSEHEGNKSKAVQQKSSGMKTFSSGGPIRHCGPQGCQ